MKMIFLGVLVHCIARKHFEFRRKLNLGMASKSENDRRGSLNKGGGFGAYFGSWRLFCNGCGPTAGLTLDMVTGSVSVSG